jgi:hypothetical protein
MRRFWWGIATQAAGILSLTDPVRKVIDKIFWNWVYQMIGPVEPIIEGYAVPVALFAFGVYLSTREGYGASLLKKVRDKLNPYYLVAGLAALVFVGALIGAWLDYRRGPINWVLDSSGSPISFWQQADGPLLVSDFNIIGHNRTDYPVPLAESFLRSDITNQILHFKIGVPGGEISTQEATVEPRGSVNLHAVYPAPQAQQSGITAERLRSEFGRFTFSVKYADGRGFEKSFSDSEVDAIINNAAKAMRKSLQRTPGVIRNPN